MPQPKLIVHRGAWNISAAYEQDHLSGALAAVQQVYPKLLSGATARKMVGRVGDSPIPRAGAFAGNAFEAASANGWGGRIMQGVFSKTVCDLFANHLAVKAAGFGITQLVQKVKGLGGIIGVSAKGHYAFARNTPKMDFCLANPYGSIQAFLKHPQ